MSRIVKIFILFCAVQNVAFGQPPTMPSTKQLPSDDASYQKEYARRILKDKLFGVYIPKDLNDAFLELDKKMDDKGKLKFQAMSEPEMLNKVLLHNWLKQNWGFELGSRISHQLKTDFGVTFPDDAVDFILLSYHRKLLGADLRSKELAEIYQQKRKKAWEERQKSAKVIEEKIKPKQ